MHCPLNYKLSLVDLTENCVIIVFFSWSSVVAIFILFSRRYYSLVVILLSAGIASLYYFIGLGDGFLYVHTLRS